MLAAAAHRWGVLIGSIGGMEESPATIASPVFAVARVIFGVALGWAIWALSPSVTGEAEPWDSMTPYYSGSLFIVGLLSSLLGRSGFYWGPIGIYIGQAAFLSMANPQGGIIPAPIAVALFGTIQPLIGALLGSGFRYMLKARKK